MSQRIGNVVIISEEKPQECQFCHETKECRPYGPNEEEICFDCAMKDKETTVKRMKTVLFGIEYTSV